MKIFTPKIHQATLFAIQVHRGINRKGKDIPYITHPLSVALILSRVSDDEDLIAAGILHDVIEDCQPYGTVTTELLAEKFGKRVAELVDSVTEQHKGLSWEERKQLALEHLEGIDDPDMILLKSADVLHNLTDLITDIELGGPEAMNKFNAAPGKTIKRYQNLLKVLEKKKAENPLLGDLQDAYQKLLNLRVL